MAIAHRPPQIFRPDPVLGWALTPNARVEPNFRPGVVQTINEYGHRNTPAPSRKPSYRLDLYGCSFTYGTGLADNETIASHLQSSVDGLAVRNLGVGGYGTLQNLLSFTEMVERDPPDVAVFNFISDHRFRNIADPERISDPFRVNWARGRIEHKPFAGLRRDGELEIRYIPFWPPIARGADLSQLALSPGLIDITTISVMKQIEILAERHSIPVAFAVLDQEDPSFLGVMTEHLQEVVDISVPLDEFHTFKPLDDHPNDVSSALYAARLVGCVERLLERAR